MYSKTDLRVGSKSISTREGSVQKITSVSYPITTLDMADKTITVSLPEVNAQNKPSGGHYPKILGLSLIDVPDGVEIS